MSGGSCQFTTMPPNPTIVNEGDSVTLQCVYTNATAISWRRDNVAIKTGSGYIVTVGGPSQSNLTIQSADRMTHNATFSCVATLTDNTTQSFDLQLLVYYIDQTVGLSLSLDSCSGSTVYNGSTVTLSCSPDAFPPPSSISWLLNENAVVEGSNIGISQDRLVLTITSIYGNQSGQWVCRAENSVGTAEGLVELAVRVLVTRSAIIEHGSRAESTNTYLVKRGGMAELNCVFTPPLFGDNQFVALSVDGSGIVSGNLGYRVTVLQCSVLLRVDPVQDIHEGTYRCRHTILGVTSQAVQLTIATIRQSYNVTMSPLSPLGVGQSVTFTCTPEGSPGNVMERLSWRFMSNQTGMSGTVSMVDPRVSIEDGGRRLVITDLTVDYSGVWSCVASNSLTSDVINSLPLTVEAPPPTSVQPDFNIVKLGTPHTLICQVISTRTIAFSWIVGGVAYEETSGRIIISNTPTTSTLTLRTLEEGDLGNVTCVATDPVHRPVSSSAVLQESPSFYIYGASERRNFTLQVDSPFRLDCGVRGGPATVRWFKGRQEVPAQGDGLQVQLLSNGTSSLRRETTLREDHGSDYLCKAERSGVDSSLTQRFNIFIFVPGMIVSAPPPESVAVLGSRYQLDCSATGQPEPLITWRFRGSPIRDLRSSSLTDYGNGSLVFHPVNKSHEGTYVCSIEAPSFLVETTILTVEDPQPTMLSGVEIALCVVIVVIAAIILIVSAVLAIVCSFQHYQRSKSTGHFEDRHDSPQGMFDRQPSLRDKDNSGILRGPSNDILDTLQKSPHYGGASTYSINPSTGFQLDMYSRTSHNSTPLHGTATSTPLHGTVASTSLFSSEDPTSVTGPLPNYPRSNLELSDVMGEGEFGPVVLGVANHIVPTHDKTLVAVKVLVSQGDEETLRPEVALMDFANQMKLSYTNIASILGICSDGEPYYVIYEYLDQGDLKKFLQGSQPEEGDPPTLTPADMRKMILQVADGMAYLFSQRIIHGDLATRNCLVSSTLEVKIADLGIGHDLYNHDYYDNGAQLLPIRWMPPELLQELEEGPNFSLHSDIWSFGVFCWEVFAYSRLPYETFEDNEILSIVPGGSRLRRPSPSCPHSLYDLMTECWSEIPDNRPQFARLCVAIVDLDFGRDTQNGYSQ